MRVRATEIEKKSKDMTSFGLSPSEPIVFSAFRVFDGLGSDEMDRLLAANACNEVTITLVCCHGCHVSDDVSQKWVEYPRTVLSPSEWSS